MAIEVLSDLRRQNNSAFFNRIAAWVPVGNSAQVTNYGIAAPIVVGTATSSFMDGVDVYDSLKKVEYLTTPASATAVAGFRGVANQWWMGNAPGMGGFNYVCQWGAATGVATSTTRAFVGMSSFLGNPTDVEPSSISNILGMGWDAADTNIQIMHNDDTDAATKIDLGSNFPVPAEDRTSAYELQLYCPPNGSSITWKVVDMVSGAVATGTISTDLPANTTWLSPRGWMSVGGTSSEIGIALIQMFIETER